MVTPRRKPNFLTPIVYLAPSCLLGRHPWSAVKTLTDCSNSIEIVFVILIISAIRLLKSITRKLLWAGNPTSMPPKHRMDAAYSAEV
jgi:hypothetical protein